jgi:hypothetical protein
MLHQKVKIRYAVMLHRKVKIHSTFRRVQNNVLLKSKKTMSVYRKMGFWKSKKSIIVALCELCIQADRDEEFSPVKNADGAEQDTPTTARQMVFAFHKKLIEAAGGKFAEAAGNSEWVPERDQSQNSKCKSSF